MVQFIPSNDQWGQAFQNMGAGVAEGYQERSDENSVRKAIMDLGDKPSARDILNALTNVKTYGHGAKQNAFSNYLGVENFEELKRKNKAQETASSTKLSPFQKKVQEKNAEEYVNLPKEIKKIETTLGDIKYAREISDELGVGGMLTGTLGLSEKAKELEGVSFTLMEPIIKMFNPSGPIAQQKLKMIQDKYVIKPSDAPWIRNAKLNALERFSTQALKRAQDKMELLRKYEGNLPDQEAQRLEKESESLANDMEKFDLQAEEVPTEGMPNPADFKDKTIKSPSGEKFFSDGTRWVKK